jgi:hypothetical protein
MQAELNQLMSQYQAIEAQEAVIKAEKDKLKAIMKSVMDKQGVSAVETQYGVVKHVRFDRTSYPKKNLIAKFGEEALAEVANVTTVSYVKVDIFKDNASE